MVDARYIGCLLNVHAKVDDINDDLSDGGCDAASAPCTQYKKRLPFAKYVRIFNISRSTVPPAEGRALVCCPQSNIRCRNRTNDRNIIEAAREV
jgi:hypothetical protein